MRIVRETVSTSQRTEMIDITARVQQAVTNGKLASGMAVVYVPHTTAAVTINENADPDVQHDLLKKMAQLVPHREPYYQHNEGNSDSHLKAAFVGSSVTILVEAGRLQLGRWQGVFFCEFDGPRERKVWIRAVAFDEE